MKEELEKEEDLSPKLRLAAQILVQRCKNVRLVVPPGPL